MRTIIIAVAVPVEDSMPAIESLLHENHLEGSSIVGVLDREQPENNYEPQIFAAFHEDRTRRGPSPVEERDHGFGVHPGWAGMEHAP